MNNKKNKNITLKQMIKNDLNLHKNKGIYSNSKKKFHFILGRSCGRTDITRDLLFQELIDLIESKS